MYFTVTEYLESLTTSDVIRTKVNGALKGAREVKRWRDAEGYHVVMELGVFGGAGWSSICIMPVIV